MRAVVNKARDRLVSQKEDGGYRMSGMLMQESVCNLLRRNEESLISFL